MAQTFRDLRVWQQAHRLVLEVYAVTTSFPREERFGLIQQLRRASVSIAANIVEGWKRSSDKDNAHFLNLADGSLEEVKYLFLLSRDLQYISDPTHHRCLALCEEVGRMLRGLYKALLRTYSL